MIKKLLLIIGILFSSRLGYSDVTGSGLTGISNSSSSGSGGGGGSGSIAVGGTVTGLTQGSVLFGNPGNTLAQDNAGLFYNPTGNRFVLGSSTTFPTSPVRFTLKSGAGQYGMAIHSSDYVNNTTGQYIAFLAESGLVGIAGGFLGGSDVGGQLSIGTDSISTLDKLGIGTNSPSTKLHLSSGVLTIDGTGAAATISGTVTATLFSGSGASITSVPAANIAAGATDSSVRISSAAANTVGPQQMNASNSPTVNDLITYGSAGQITYVTPLSNVMQTTSTDTVTSSKTFTGVINFQNASNTLTGNGAAITSLNASNLASGTVPAARLQLGNDGWISDSNTWTGIGTSSFTINADVTAYLGTGMKLKYTQSATTQYAHVLSVSYTAALSTVTVVVNSSYTLTAASMTSPFYSNAQGPLGFPSALFYTPTYTGFSANPTTAGATRYWMVGKTIHIELHPSAAGTSNSASFLVSLPATSAVTPVNDGSALGFYTGGCGVVDAGVVGTTFGKWDVLASTTNARITKDFTGTGFTATGSKTALCHDITYEVP